MLLLAFGCGTDGDPPPREVTAELVVSESGLSDAFDFEVPAATRSVTVVVEGAEEALYALGSFSVDGIDLVALPEGAPGEAMRASYEDEQIGQMAGGLYQTIRLGTFTHVYPYAPEQPPPVGRSSLRVASDTPGPVQLTILMPEDDGARVLHLNVAVVSETLTEEDPPAFLDEAAAILAQADVSIVVDQVATFRGSGLSAITDFSEPQERPDSMAAMLPGLVTPGADGPALDVFIVDSLPFGVAGLSLGTPGPPIPGSYYFGVVLVRPESDEATARVLVHEVGHFLALQHVENLGVSGAVYPDPLDDTSPGDGNLMENGTTLTADQSWSLKRSALLSLD